MTKSAILAALLMASTIAPAMASHGGSVCLHTYQIDRTKVVDAKTILFKMKDGKVWRNTLLQRCPGLLFDGFAYMTPDNEICGNQQSIRMLRTHEVCLLGPFTPDHRWHG